MFLSNQDTRRKIVDRAGIAQLVEHWPAERQVSRLSHTNIWLPVCGRDNLAAMLATKRSAGVAPAVNLEECVTYVSAKCE